MFRRDLLFCFSLLFLACSCSCCGILAARAFAAFRANPFQTQAFCFAGDVFVVANSCVVFVFRFFIVGGFWPLGPSPLLGGSPLAGQRLVLPEGQEAAARRRLVKALTIRGNKVIRCSCGLMDKAPPS